MSELAYNINGEGFEPPETATGWRVRRMKPRGAPEVVYGKDGLPLTIPLESDLEELRRNVDSAGRFRLDAIDDRGRNVDGAQPAYVVVAHRAEDSPAVELIAAPTKLGGTEHVIAEAMRLNTELAKSVIDRFPEMMHAAAELLRAADGAGLPARKPRELESDDDDEDDDDAPEAPASSPAFEFINTLVAQVIPLVVTGLTSKKLPSIGAILDWRKAVPERAASHAQADSDAVTPSEQSSALPPLSPSVMAHFIAIQSALKPDEAALARAVAAELAPAQLREWFDELSKLGVPEAVAKIRTLIASQGKNGTPS